MKTCLRLLTVAAIWLAPLTATAGPCDDLARQAMTHAGKWTALKELPPRTPAEDGPWRASSDDEKPDPQTAGFAPHFPNDRARLLKETGPDGRAAAYLSPTPEAFYKAMGPVMQETDAGEIAVRVHRWAGTDIFAVSAHDEHWYDCQREIALFYRDAQGQFRYAPANNISDCMAKGDDAVNAQPYLIDGHFAFINEQPYPWSGPSQVDRHLDVYLWQGDRLADACPLNYYYDVTYSLSDMTSPEDDSGHARKPGALDTYLSQNFQAWMQAYRKADLPSYAGNLKRFQAFAAGDNRTLFRLKSAYDALIAHGRVSQSDFTQPVTVDGSAYLVLIRPTRGTGTVIFPNVDIVLYSVGGKTPSQLADIMLDRNLSTLLAVKVERAS